MKIDKEASKKMGVPVMKDSAPKTEMPKRKTWEKKEKEEKNESDFVRDED